MEEPRVHDQVYSTMRQIREKSDKRELEDLVIEFDIYSGASLVGATSA